MSIPSKIIVILGPTASGKSEMAVKLALRLSSGQAKKLYGINGAEVVSADSRQVYKGLDIGSGKITKKEMRGVPHHCLDIVSPKKVFSVVEYKQCAEKAIEDILARGKIPIICGGTGFYIQAIIDNIVLPEVAPNWKLRKQLEKKSVDELFEMLKKLDPERAKNIDAKNPRRLMRAIEIVKALGKVPKFVTSDVTNYKFLQIGINPPEKVLKKKIEKRIKKMLSDGLTKETKKIHEPVSKGGLGLSWKRINELGFEYRYPAMFLQKNLLRFNHGKTSQTNKTLVFPEEMLEKMILENWHYAKRQMTWFKRDERIKWLAAPDFKKAEKIISRELKNIYP